MSGQGSGQILVFAAVLIASIASFALARAVAKKRTVSASAGTFRTDDPTFVALLVGVIVLTAGLMVLPALTLGPIVEGLAT